MLCRDRQRVEGDGSPVAGRSPDAGEVLARLAEDTGWSFTTVHTYLTRMARGLVA